MFFSLPDRQQVAMSSTGRSLNKFDMIGTILRQTPTPSESTPSSGPRFGGTRLSARRPASAPRARRPRRPGSAGARNPTLASGRPGSSGRGVVRSAASLPVAGGGADRDSRNAATWPCERTRAELATLFGGVADVDDVLINEDNVLDLLETDVGMLAHDELALAAENAASESGDFGDGGGVGGLPHWEGMSGDVMASRVIELEDELGVSRGQCESLQLELQQARESLESARLALWRAGLLGAAASDTNFPGGEAREPPLGDRHIVLREQLQLAGRDAVVSVAVARRTSPTADDALEGTAPPRGPGRGHANLVASDAVNRAVLVSLRGAGHQIGSELVPGEVLPLAVLGWEWHVTARENESGVVHTTAFRHGHLVGLGLSPAGMNRHQVARSRATDPEHPDIMTASGLHYDTLTPAAIQAADSVLVLWGRSIVANLCLGSTENSATSDATPSREGTRPAFGDLQPRPLLLRAPVGSIPAPGQVDWGFPSHTQHLGQHELVGERSPDQDRERDIVYDDIAPHGQDEDATQLAYSFPRCAETGYRRDRGASAPLDRSAGSAGSLPDALVVSGAGTSSCNRVYACVGRDPSSPHGGLRYESFDADTGIRFIVHSVAVAAQVASDDLGDVAYAEAGGHSEQRTQMVWVVTSIAPDGPETNTASTLTKVFYAALVTSGGSTDLLCDQDAPPPEHGWIIRRDGAWPPPQVRSVELKHRAHVSTDAKKCLGGSDLGCGSEDDANEMSGTASVRSLPVRTSKGGRKGRKGARHEAASARKAPVRPSRSRRRRRKRGVGSSAPGTTAGPPAPPKVPSTLKATPPQASHGIAVDVPCATLNDAVDSVAQVGGHPFDEADLRPILGLGPDAEADESTTLAIAANTPDPEIAKFLGKDTSIVTSEVENDRIMTAPPISGSAPSTTMTAVDQMTESQSGAKAPPVETVAPTVVVPSSTAVAAQLPTAPAPISTPVVHAPDPAPLLRVDDSHDRRATIIQQMQTDLALDTDDALFELSGDSAATPPASGGDGGDGGDDEDMDFDAIFGF